MLLVQFHFGLGVGRRQTDDVPHWIILLQFPIPNLSTFIIVDSLPFLHYCVLLFFNISSFNSCLLYSWSWLYLDSVEVLFPCLLCAWVSSLNSEFSTIYNPLYRFHLVFTIYNLEPSHYHLSKSPISGIHTRIHTTTKIPRTYKLTNCKFSRPRTTAHWGHPNFFFKNTSTISQKVWLQIILRLYSSTKYDYIWLLTIEIETNANH